MTLTATYKNQVMGNNFAANSEQATWQDFLTLLKPGVMSLVVFTYISGALLAPGQLHPILFVISIICVALASGAAGAINMWYDRDIDAIMKRTAARPIPAGKISPNDALAFGVLLAGLSIIMMLLTTNILASFVLGLSVAFYVFIYTIWLKRLTPQNIVIGGAAGAFPPVIGWAAVTGTLSLESISLFIIMFLWTPPHFWALALHQADEYRRANIPMLPVIRGARATYQQILIYTLLLVTSTYLPYLLPNFIHKFYGLTVSVLNAIFIYYAVSAMQQQTRSQSLKLFWYSIIYLFALFTMMVIDHYMY